MHTSYPAGAEKMPGPSATLRRRAHRPRVGATAGLLAIACALVLAYVLAPGHARVVAAVRPAQGLARLPLSARDAVSAALGAEQAPYRLHVGAGGVLTASNPAQRLTLRFSAAGVQVDGPAITWGLGLASVSDGDGPQAVAPASPSASANRATYSHAGVNEWYANGPLGLEQGFTVTRPSAGSPGATLTLAMSMSGDATPSLSPDGRTLTLRRQGARPLHYGALAATDARGRSLPAHLALQAGRLALVVDTLGASYPIRVDPLVAAEETLTGGVEEKDEKSEGGGQGEGAFAHGALGYSVALSADGATALVGAPDDAGFTGGVWVFVRSNGEWSQQGSKLTPGPGATKGEPCIGEGGEGEGCAFGRSVALSADGNTALVGGPRQAGPCHEETQTECPNQGAVWVFDRSGSGPEASWSQAQLLEGGEETPEGHFGRSVAISGDGSTAVIGGTADTGGHGALWVFGRAGGQWTQKGAKILLAGEQGEGHVGASIGVSNDGSIILAGAPGDASQRGAAWVLTRESGGWFTQKLTGDEERGEAHFGNAVALSADGSTAIVGGRRDDGGRGAIWVFAPSGGSWVQQGPKLTGDAEEGDDDQAAFGSGVALSANGNTALIGAPGDENKSGAAWLFARSGGEWVQQGPKLLDTTAAGETRRGEFGASVAVRADGLTAIVGAPLEDRTAGAVWPFYDPGLLPGVTSIQPGSGPAGGGTSVTLRGERLDGVEAVMFGNAAAPFTVNPDGSITATSPAANPGTVCVQVHTPQGPSPCAPATAYTYLPVPSVSAISPATGPTSGGTAVTISGAAFAAGASIHFGFRSAASVQYVGENTIVAVSPPAPAGKVDVTVTTAAGTSRGVAADRFTYSTEPASSTSSLPASATAAGSPGASGGVLALGPTPRGGACVSLASTTVSVLGRGRAQVRLRGGATGTCRGRLLLTVSRRSHSHGRTVIRTTTIATSTFAVTATRVRTVTIAINRLGRALLVSAHGRLGASLAFLAPRVRASIARAASVRLVVRRPSPAKPHRA